MERMSATFDQRALTINPIRSSIVRYATMLIGYKIYYTNRDNLVIATVIHVAQDMVEKNFDYDLCELLQQQLMEKLEIKKKYVFKYGILVMCLFFYFSREVSMVGIVNWSSARLVAHQIGDYMRGLGDMNTQDYALVAFFAIF